MDDEEILNKVSFFSKLPRWLRIILIVLSIVTIVYWSIWLFIKLWNLIGKGLHWISRKDHWWLYTSVILILVIGGLLIAQLFSDLNPLTNFINSIKSLIHNIRDYLAKLISG